MFRTLVASAFIMVLCLSHTSPAYADGKLSDAAYEEGKKALDDKNLKGALVHFKSALALAKGDEGRTWQLLIAISLTYKDMGLPAYTLEYHQRFLAETKAHLEVMSPKWQKRRAWVEQDIEALQNEAGQTHAYVSVTSTPRGAAVFIEGEQAGADGTAKTPYALYIKPGTYKVSVSHKGQSSEVRTLEAAAGKTHPLTFKLAEVKAPAPPAQTAEVSASQADVALPVETLYTPRPRTLRIALGWSTAGVGMAAVAGGAILLGLAGADKSQSDEANTQVEAQAYIDAANAKLTPGWALVGVGSAAIVAGVLWAYINVKKEKSEQTWIAPSTHGIVLGGRF